ncbi:MAG: DUF2190 family protein [Deltaproteobacteria bacterium]|nr:DUF2190 family protein [Deltaproteobacteria bacterium]
MSKSFVQTGEVLDYVNVTGRDLTSGEVIVVGSRIAVAAVDIPKDSEGSADLVGVFRLAKEVAATFNQGDKLFWDPVNNYLTKNSAGNIPAGMVFKEAPSGEAEALCRLESS